MLETPFYADIHLHPSLKSSNWTKEDGEKNPWETFNHITPKTAAGRFASNASSTLAKYTQTNFYKLMEGKCKVAFVSLYPFERGFLEMRNVPRLITSKKAVVELTAIASGMGYEAVEQIANEQDYFKEFKKEYDYLKKHEGKSPCGKYSYKIVNNYGELVASMKKENELAIILTSEGAHAFFDKEMSEGKLGKADLKKRLTENIQKVKEWENPPFFMNLMHHFDNRLGGHAKSLDGFVNNLLNQRKALELGLEGLGIKAMKEMLSNRNGKRILIDTKHMSLKARVEYYNWIRSYNYLNKDNNIPVICSHTGVNGFKTMHGSKIKTDNPAKKKNSYFFNWAINLSDEELNIIHGSQGLMGLIIDKGKLGGGAFLAKADKTKDKEKLKEMYMKLIWDNLFHAVKAIGNKSGWDIFALGTDFDGAINHVEFYDDATKLPLLYQDLYEYLDRTKYEKSLWFDYKPEELLDKLFRANVMNFMERNFV
ncbi:MAG: membrane dipeptidase [Chitinophagales bacterium]|nr:membrane dipeptidase [Chitinophagales bacterium]